MTGKAVQFVTLKGIQSGANLDTYNSIKSKIKLDDGNPTF